MERDLFDVGAIVTLVDDRGEEVRAEVTGHREERGELGRRRHLLSLRATDQRCLDLLSNVVGGDYLDVKDAPETRFIVRDRGPEQAGPRAEQDKFVVGLDLEQLSPRE
jgi:hypothetical protein